MAQISALWEATHERPELLTRWRPDSEAQLLMYLDEYDGKFSDLELRATYEHVRDE